MYHWFMEKSRIKKRYFLYTIPVIALLADYLIYQQNRKINVSAVILQVVKKIYWIGIAAAVIIMLMLSFVLFLYLQEKAALKNRQYSDEVVRKFFVPINAVIGLSSECRQYGKKEEELHENSDQILTIAKRMKHMLRDIETYNMLRNKKMTLAFSAVNLRDLVELTVRYCGDKISAQSIQIRNDVAQNIYVHADPLKLQMVLGNILTVLVNFTQEGTISIGAKKRTRFVEITVHDSGIGIDKNVHNIIFEPFDGANNISNGHYSGTGLSLAIARELIDLHRGRIWINKKLVDTAEFHFTILRDDNLRNSFIPVFTEYNEFRQVHKAPLQRLHETESMGNILLLKPSSVQKNVFVTYLYHAGYNLYLPENAQKALLEVNLNKKYDLIMIDELIGASAFELCRQVRQNYGLTELPVLLVVPNDRQANLARAYEVGANDCMDYMIMKEQLEAKVKMMVQIKKATQEAVASQVNLLQAQIQPHFLYNALNVITELCVDNPPRAQAVLMDFSQYLRSKFKFSQDDKTVTINQEISTIQSYLNVEKARFGDRLQYQIDRKGSGERMIPALIVQPLVENAVKHGIGSLAEGGMVSISFEELPDRTLISVQDNGKGMPRRIEDAIAKEDAAQLGTGVLNVIKRLRLYHCGKLQLENVASKGVTLRFEIPLTTA